VELKIIKEVLPPYDPVADIVYLISKLLQIDRFDDTMNAGII
jgi:hypothetical protein